jgi:hypothetical protein
MSPLNNPTVNEGRKQGIYCLANDRVLEWFHALLHSYQLTNAVLPLVVIPYDRAVSHLRELAGKYNFTILEESACAKFDSLAVKIMGDPTGAGMFRKWAAFVDNQFDEFIFLDADIVMLEPLDQILDVFSKAPCDLVYFDTCMEWVYRPECAAEMVTRYQSPGMNAGAFVSRRNLITDEEIFATAELAARDRIKFVAGQRDQPFFNYVFDVSRRRRLNLTQLLPHMAPFESVRQVLDWNPGTRKARDAQGRTVPFLHWPGCNYPRILRKEIFLHFRLLGLSPVAHLSFLIKFHPARAAAILRFNLLRLKGLWLDRLNKLLKQRQWRSYYIRKMLGLKCNLPE